MSEKKYTKPETFQQYLMRARSAVHINAPKGSWDSVQRGENHAPGRNARKRQERAGRALDRLTFIAYVRGTGHTGRVPKMKHVPDFVFA